MKNRQGTWRKFFTPANIILIITLVVGLIAIPVSMFAQGVSIIEQAVLAVVTVLTGAQLTNSYSSMKQDEKWGEQHISQQEKLDEYHRTQQEIWQVIKDFPSGQIKSRRDIVPLEKFTENAEGVLIIARTASKVAGLSNFFQKQLERGCRVRFVITNPEAYHQNDIEAVTPMPLTGESALSVFAATVKATLNNIQSLQKFSENTRGKVEVRLVNYISNLSFVAVDEENGRGKILVELMPYKCPEQDRPHIELASHDRNQYWYNWFKETCEETWNKATSMAGQNSNQVTG